MQSREYQKKRAVALSLLISNVLTSGYKITCLVIRTIKSKDMPDVMKI